MFNFHSYLCLLHIQPCVLQLLWAVTRAGLASRTRDPLLMCDQEREELGEHFGHKQSVCGRDDEDKSVCYRKWLIMIVSTWFLNWQNWNLCTKDRYTLEEQYFKLSNISPWFKFNHGPLKTTLTLDLKNCYVICKYVLYLAFSLSWFKNWSLVEFKCLHCSGASHKDQETWSDLILLFINTWRKRVGMGIAKIMWTFCPLGKMST